MTMPWVPKDKRDTRYYLFATKFRCRLPYERTLSLDDLHFFGVPTSGDRKMDQDMMKSDVDRYLTTNDMFEYWRQGVAIKVTQYGDTKKIYEIIENHLNAMKKEISISFSTSHIPVNDLLELDRFAQVVYDKAKYNFKKDDIESLIAKRMSQVIRFTPTNLLGEEKEDPKAFGKITHANALEGEEEEKEDKYAKRPSMAQYFQGVAKRNRNGGI